MIYHEDCPESPESIDDLIKEARKLVAAATPGPWIAGSVGHHKCVFNSRRTVLVDEDALTTEDVALIASAPALITRLVNALEEINEEFKEEMNSEYTADGVSVWSRGEIK